MKMGIERILKENFPNISSISAVDAMELESPTLSMLKEVSDSLRKIQPAVQAMGGNITVKDVFVETSTVHVQFSGPFKLKKGVEMVLKDSPRVKNVVFEEES